eukprot:TRINITY_DN8171_c0_g1_i1.p1 TRINITY_DN8171_c0_g1~~TRINITY_DN8171_c0_g1_i1.p1  ORF type:complete len:173 (-),score=29.02 TRINITY_DN8171_c0_g1_i1:236-754(-)
MPSLRQLRRLKHKMKVRMILGDTLSPNPPPPPKPSENKLERIADEILSLNKIEMHDFGILFRLKLGLNRFINPNVAAGIFSQGSSQVSGSAAPAAEQTVSTKSTFDVKLEKYDASAKIKIIKEVRAFTDLGLKEAKELVEKVPTSLKKGLSKEEAEKIVEKLKELGATAVVE